MARVRRTDCSRGILLALHDHVRPGVRHKVHMGVYVSREADADLIQRAAGVGITKSGLAALIIEAATAHGLIDFILDDPTLSTCRHLGASRP